MNKLKSINDMYGHRIGDEALKALAAELKKMAGPDCMAARIGGDEFGVVLPAYYDILSARRTRARCGSGITHLLNRSCGQSHIHFRERRNRALSRRRHDRHRTSRISRQVDVRAEAWLIGRLGATSG
jgi:GGDEF domain-containing protein